jgi:PQ loop repeat
MTRRPGISAVIFVLAISATIPQIAKTVQTQTVGDFSEWSLLLNIASNALLGWYGYVVGEMGFVLLGAWFVAYWGYLLLLKEKQH